MAGTRDPNTFFKKGSSIENISDLRDLMGSEEGQIAEVLGYWEANDVLNIPDYYWSSTSNEPDNSGNIIKPNSVSGAGRWIYEPSSIDPKWFGAIGDGVNDDYQAIQAAIDSSYPIIFSVGQYKITQQLIGKSGLKLLSPFTQDMDSTTVAIRSTTSDLGDGNAILKLAPGTTQIQSVEIQGISFIGDTVADSGNLNLISSAGIVGIDPSGVKDGLLIERCLFRKMSKGIAQISNHGYLGGITIRKSKFKFLYKCFDSILTTTGVNFEEVYCYDNYSLGEINRVVGKGVYFNNSSYSGENVGLVFDFGKFENLWLEGYNRTLVPNIYLEISRSYFSESFSTGGTTKFSINPIGEDIQIKLKGVRVATNTRVFDMSNIIDLNKAYIEFETTTNGGSFGNQSNVIDYVKLGLNFKGFNNEDTEWNIESFNEIIEGPDYTYNSNDDAGYIKTFSSVNAASTSANNAVGIKISCSGNRSILLYSNRSGTNVGADYVVKGTNSGGTISERARFSEIGNLTITGTYSPFTGTHKAYSKEDLNVGELVKIKSSGFEQDNTKQPIWNAFYCSESEKGIFGIVYDIIDVYEDMPSIKSLTKEFNELFESNKSLSIKDFIKAKEESLKIIETFFLIACVGDMFGTVSSDSEPIDYGDYLCTSSEKGKIKKYNGNDLRFVIGRAGSNAVSGNKIAISKE